MRRALIIAAALVATLVGAISASAASGDLRVGSPQDFETPNPFKAVEAVAVESNATLYYDQLIGLKTSDQSIVAVMYLGRIVEIGTTEQVLGDPQHPYTKALLAVAPRVAQRTGPRDLLRGEPPDATAIPSGCRFHPRCPVAFDRCPVDDPRLPDSERGAACWRVLGT